jgi:hypothetical protein
LKKGRSSETSQASWKILEDVAHGGLVRRLLMQASMTLPPSTPLDELLLQHDVIRQLSSICDELIEAVEADASRVPELVLAVSRLRWAVNSHCRDEERLLATAQREDDGVRHREEHAALGKSLEHPAIASLRQTIGLLRAHLEEEETVLLAAHVLRREAAHAGSPP